MCLAKEHLACGTLSLDQHHCLEPASTLQVIPDLEQWSSVLATPIQLLTHKTCENNQLVVVLRLHFRGLVSSNDNKDGLILVAV